MPYTSHADPVSRLRELIDEMCGMVSLMGCTCKDLPHVADCQGYKSANRFASRADSIVTDALRLPARKRKGVI